jgi:RNA polymerase sigma-70 factor (ECF subfamily)
LDEAYFISRLKQQDKVVFNFIFSYYYSGLCVYARQFICSAEAAEDIVQDFFVTLWVKASDITINDSLRSYLFSSVKNRCLDAIRHKKVRERYEEAMIVESTPGMSDCYSIFVESELRDAINKSLAKLPPRCREVFFLSRYHGKSNQQIAEKLGISKRTVELQISNALKILRVELKPFLPIILLLFRVK